MKEIRTQLPPFTGSRYVVKNWTDSYGQQKAELDAQQVQEGFNDIANQMSVMADHINYLHRVIGDVNKFLSWVEDIRPEITAEYKSQVTADKVARRIEEGPGEAAVCEAG